jgi:hypothetical protein
LAGWLHYDLEAGRQMNRRQFLAGFAAALAVHKLPKHLVPFIPERATDFIQASRLAGGGEGLWYGAGGGEGLWAMLYELDPNMQVSIDHSQMIIHLFSSYDFEMIRKVLWNYKPIGILAILNGERVSFEDDYFERFQ